MGRQRYDVVAVGKKKAISAHKHCINRMLDEISKGRINLVKATCICPQKAHSDSTCCILHFFRFTLGINWIARIAEVSDRFGRRHSFEEKLEALSGHFSQQEIDACEISIGSVETTNKTDSNGIGTLHKDDRDCLGGRFGRERGICAFYRDKDRYLTADQFGDERWQSIVSALSPPVFDRNGTALHVAGVPKASMKCGEIIEGLLERCKVNKADHRHRWLLRASRKRPRCR
jgi:hypothetical protein